VSLVFKLKRGKKDYGRQFYFFDLAILLLINTFESNDATMNIGRIIHDGNSGTVGVGVGFWEE